MIFTAVCRTNKRECKFYNGKVSTIYIQLRNIKKKQKNIPYFYASVN